MHREFAGRGLVILAVNIRESRSVVARWVADKRLTFRVLLDMDGAVTDAYRVTGTPTVFLIDHDGRLVGQTVGPRPWMGEKGRALINALLVSPAP